MTCARDMIILDGSYRFARVLPLTTFNQYSTVLKSIKQRQLFSQRMLHVTHFLICHTYGMRIWHVCQCMVTSCAVCVCVGDG